jgi:hypothetical protein
MVDKSFRHLAGLRGFNWLIARPQTVVQSGVGQKRHFGSTQSG